MSRTFIHPGLPTKGLGGLFPITRFVTGLARATWTKNARLLEVRHQLRAGSPVLGSCPIVARCRLRADGQTAKENAQNAQTLTAICGIDEVSGFGSQSGLRDAVSGSRTGLRDAVWASRMGLRDPVSGSRR